ncbi:hypothetical protein MUP59_05655 [Candidatus Bathyarchaeota archaeon]|nr:hypothetical protein [Candidatus Bathyarchaeota archaeon]
MSPYNFKGLDVSVVFSGITYQSSLEEDMLINSTDLDGEFVEQPRKFVWWAVLSEVAKDLLAQKKYEMEQLYARLDHEKRTVALNAKVKLTEKMTENEVITDPRYQKCMAEYLEIKKQNGMLMAGKEAMSQRKDMLISLGANYRAEGNADPVILQEVAKMKATRLARTRAKTEVESTESSTTRTPVVKQPVRAKE